MEEKTYIDRKSRYRDLVFYKSTNSTWLNLAMIVDKPEKPSYILATTHDLNESIDEFMENEDKPSKYLHVHIDMRGRRYSDGREDLNGFELLDIIDGIEYVKKAYKDLIVNPDVVYFEGENGAGGNALELAAKFPDYFSSIISINGISDYKALMDSNPDCDYSETIGRWMDSKSEEAFKTRSAIYGLKNLCTPICLIYGNNDGEILKPQSMEYRMEAGRKRRARLIECHDLDMNTIDIESIADKHRMEHGCPIEIPRKGKLVIKGYIVTKRFSVYLRDIDEMAEFHYDMDKGKYHVECGDDTCYTIRFPLKRMEYDD